MDPLESIERLAARARLEQPPLVRVDPYRIARDLARPTRSPTLVLCLSSAVTGLAACLVLFLALNTQSASASASSNTSSNATPTRVQPQISHQTDQSQTSANSANQNQDQTADPDSTLFNPLKLDLP